MAINETGGMKSNKMGGDNDGSAHHAEDNASCDTGMSSNQ